jgi:hypothetical protein
MRAEVTALGRSLMDIAWLLALTAFFGACGLALRLVDGLRGEA